MSEKSLPLEGIRVVDIAMYLAGPMCARILGEWGAEVIKVEPPSSDLWRLQPNTVPPSDNFNPPYHIGNQCKKHICLDLKQALGKEALFKILEDTDVLITSFRTPALERLGLTYDELSDRFPWLVYAQITGYGEQGPDCDKPGFDTIAFWARTGLLVDTVQRGGSPVVYPGTLGDVPSATYMAAGVMAALFRSRSSGKGCKVTTSLFSSALWTVSSLMVSAQEPYGESFPMDREKSPVLPTINSYRCADNEWVYISIPNIYQLWDTFAQAIEKPEWIGDKNFSTNIPYIRQNSEAIVAGIADAFSKKTSFDWEEIFTRAGIPHQRCKHIIEQIDDPQAWENKYLYRQTFQNGKSVVMASNPIQFSDVEQQEYAPVGRLGEETREILSRYYTEDEIDALLNGKIARAAE